MDQSESAFFIDQSEILKTLLSLDIFSIQMVFQLNFCLYLVPILEFYFQIFRRSIQNNIALKIKIVRYIGFAC